MRQIDTRRTRRCPTMGFTGTRGRIRMRGRWRPVTGGRDVTWGKAAGGRHTGGLLVRICQCRDHVGAGGRSLWWPCDAVSTVVPGARRGGLQSAVGAGRRRVHQARAARLRLGTAGAGTRRPLAMWGASWGCPGEEGGAPTGRAAAARMRRPAFAARRGDASGRFGSRTGCHRCAVVHGCRALGSLEKLALALVVCQSPVVAVWLQTPFTHFRLKHSQDVLCVRLGPIVTVLAAAVGDPCSIILQQLRAERALHRC